MSILILSAIIHWLVSKTALFFLQMEYLQIISIPNILINAVMLSLFLSLDSISLISIL